MKIHEIMSEHVLTASAETTVRELWKKLFSRHVNAIPIVGKKNELMGIVTKEDLLKILYPDFQEYFADIGAVDDFEEMEGKVKSLGSTKVKDVMCKVVVYTRAETPIMRALSRMIVRSINQLPVLDQNDRVIGMVTKGDIFYALVKREVGTKKSAQSVVTTTTAPKKKKSSKKK